MELVLLKLTWLLCGSDYRGRIVCHACGTSVSLPLMLFSHVFRWWLAFKLLVVHEVHFPEEEENVSKIRPASSNNSEKLPVSVSAELCLEGWLSPRQTSCLCSEPPCSSHQTKVSEQWAVCGALISEHLWKRRPHPFLVMKQLIKVYSVGLCNSIYSTEW